MATPIYVFEDSQYDRLFPLTMSRPACLLRCGALTLLERMTRAVGGEIAGVLMRDPLAGVWRNKLGVAVNPAVSTKEGVILVNGRWLALGGKWERPAADMAGLVQGAVAWVHLSAKAAGEVDFSKMIESRTLEALLPELQRNRAEATLIGRPWELLGHQDAALREDFAHFGAGNEATVMPGAHLLGADKIHLARRVKVWPGVVLDAQAGPIMVEEGTEIRANAVVTGPVHIGKNCLVRPGADVRELCSFGPGARVGGEVMHSIFLGNANKQHYGFLGQSIVGEWANLGAGTTTSNLKNTYGTVRVRINGMEEDSGLQFLGSVIGDHAKLGIGTYLSTGSVVGFGSHVITPRPPKFVPSFAWVTGGGGEGVGGTTRMDFGKLEAIAKTVMHRRGVEWGPADHELFVRIAGEYAAAEKFDWTGK